MLKIISAFRKRLAKPYRYFRRIRKRYKVLILSPFLLFLLFLTLDLIFPFRIKTDYSQLVLAEDSSILHVFLSKDDKWRIKTELHEITPLLYKSIIYKEDKYFRFHLGINPVSIVKALFRNIQKGRVVSGASTITMQVARLLKPGKRTYKNKILEMFRAMQLEFHYSKNDILLMYINLVPYGGNIEGMKSASLIYYEQMPEALSLAQVISLSIIPNNPSKLVLGKNNSKILEERNAWLKRLHERKIFSSSEIRTAMCEPVIGYRHATPRLAPHFSLLLRGRFPEKHIIHSTLKTDIQQKTESLVYNYIRRCNSTYINNAAVLVLNNYSGQVEAYVGSADFHNHETQGQVNGIQAIRSPGSALKPFLYALAIDQGLITPKYIIYDIPSNFKGYTPQNYDSEFRGRISTEDALAQSLNIPAVKILEMTGLENFIDKLADLGFLRILSDRKKLGFSVALGGCGVSLEELTQAYASFANEGIYKKYKYLLDDHYPEHDTLFSAESCYMITQILSKSNRPDFPGEYESTVHLPKIAWKTGTSYGRRDAWSVGYNKKYTIGVWVGNFPGYGVPDLHGAGYAAPLLFEIFNCLNYDGIRDWFQEPPGIDYRLVCVETGLPPNSFCDNLVMDAFIPGVSHYMKCTHMKNIYLHPEERFSYCRLCLPKTGYKKVLMPNLPADMIAFCEENKMPYTKIPPHNPNCTRIFDTEGPQIISPNEDTEYILMEGEEQKLLLKANAENDVQFLYWYINDTLLKKVKNGESIFFKPGKGEIKISCTDDKGRNTDIWIHVQYI
jgi:penicillin-binding protein 1C